MSTRFVPVILLSTLLGIWLLSACGQPISPSGQTSEATESEAAPDSSSASEASSPPSTPLGVSACETIFDMDDPGRVFENPALGAYYIYWTFHINFPNPSDSGEPVVCFQLYGRDPSRPDGYVDLSGGAQVMGTCTTKDEVNYSVDSVERSSRDRDFDVSTGAAEMSGRGYITCPINLREWAASLSVPPISAQTESALNQFKTDDIQYYETFSIVAAGEVGVDQKQDAENPIVYYLPESIPELSVAMALPTVDDDIGTYDATLPGVVYERPTCSYVIGDPYYWWTNFDTTEVSSPDEIELTFANRAINSGTYERCPNLISEPPHELAFWTGPAILYIGCHPDVDGEVEGGDCLSLLKGRLYGIVFDPVDSKPQSN